MSLFKKKSVESNRTGNKVFQRADASYLQDAQQAVPYDPTIYKPHQSTRYLYVRLDQNGFPMNLKDGEWKECAKPLPELYSGRQFCCGCTACYAICPVNAISMAPDEKGFDYPVVDARVCIRCYKCDSVCPIKNKIKV